MKKTIDLEQIQSLLPQLDLIPLIEEGFVAYSNGQSTVPPVGELHLDKGEVHIKYGFIESQPYYVIKIASGFYLNAELGLSTSGGCMLVFCQRTGQLMSVLLDDGYLTDVRTAVAGAIAAKYLAPENVKQIGIVGTGIQALAQLEHLRAVVDCRNVLVWGRSQEKLDRYLQRADELPSSNETAFQIETTMDLAAIQNECNLIVTTTPSSKPLLIVDHLQAGTHLTAVGSDMSHKQEIDSKILERADLVVADSIEQCKLRGEISHAIRNGNISQDQVIELGNVISGRAVRRTSEDQITVADLTGVAVQDIQIASAVFDASLANDQS